MTISSIEYAFLSHQAYESWHPDQTTDILQSPSGYGYTVLAVLDDPTGYYGVVFQNETTGDIIAVHRGTQSDGDAFRDLFITDAAMAVGEINNQRPAAEFLVFRALEIAAAEGKDRSTVSVTGHSLGGALAQMTAVEFGLYGETFNAYGAADLIGDSQRSADLVNHVRVTDIVGNARKDVGEAAMCGSGLSRWAATRMPPVAPIMGNPFQEYFLPQAVPGV